jgi:hypothetical protein
VKTAVNAMSTADRAIIAGEICRLFMKLLQFGRAG